MEPYQANIDNKAINLSSNEEKADNRDEINQHDDRICSEVEFDFNQQLETSTIEAMVKEMERIKRIKNQESFYHQILPELRKTHKNTDLILDVCRQSKIVQVAIDPILGRFLKPHQVQGIKFMYNSTIENVERLKEKDEGSGCILAHYPGSGKTFQVIAFVHSLLTTTQIKNHVKSILIAVPMNTLLYWREEYFKWTLAKDLRSFDIHTILKKDDIDKNSDLLNRWRQKGGAILIGHYLLSELMTLINLREKNGSNDTFLSQCLVDPGPDLVIIDEGHLVTCPSTEIYEIITSMKTRRKIILTGTPLTNSLLEYRSLVNIIKPSLLGTKREFINRFQNPIENHVDFDSLNKQSKELHKLTSGSIQRFNVDTMKSYLPSKVEHVIYFQSDVEAGTMRNEGFKSANWFQPFVKPDNWEELHESRKFKMLLKIIESCIAVDDKLIVVSPSTERLNLIRNCLRDKLDWKMFLNFVQIDEDASCKKRENQVHLFNDPKNKDARLCLLSCDDIAESLTGANRVVIFDVSWNSIVDIQSISRVFRLGQTKPVYVYRFVTKDTMEEEIFQKQIIDLALVSLVVDGKMVKRPFETFGNLLDYTPDSQKEVTISSLAVSKDPLLADILKCDANLVLGCVELNSLLEDNHNESQTSGEKTELEPGKI